MAEATATSAQLPRFEDYPVTDVFKGTPAAPIFATAEQGRFRGLISDGVTHGIGVLREGKEQPGPNFAGRYIAITWSCGSPCGRMAIVDAATGNIYNAPLSEGFLLPSLPAAIPGDPDHFVPWVADMDFRQTATS
jgi:hypothetical protein